MSYARWDSADVYVFASTAGYVECCGCQFESHETEPYQNFFGHTMKYTMGSAELHSPAEVVAHMRRHREAGHFIPDELLDPKLYRPTDFLVAGTPAHAAAEAAYNASQAVEAAEVMAAVEGGTLTVDTAFERAQRNMQLWARLNEYQRAHLSEDDYFLELLRR